MKLFSRYLNALSSERSHIQTLRMIIIALILFCTYLGYVVQSLPRTLVVHNPPELRTGSTRKWWEVPESSVYAFSLYIFQQLNRWHTNGEEDYKGNIDKLRAYLTPQCYQFLQDDYTKRLKEHELYKRVRSVQEMPGRGFNKKKVQIISENDWYVTLDLNTDEYYVDEPVKTVYVRYPLHVVRMDIDPELNPWGLGLNCYYQTPQLIKFQSEDPDNLESEQGAK